MSTVAIGDIHGNLPALESLLDSLVPTLSQGDVLVFLGDYIDGGPDTRGCLERLVRLKEELPCPVVGVLGNHEVWMLRTLRDPTSHSWLIATDAMTTIASYSAEAAKLIWKEFEQAGRSLLTGKALPYEAFFDLVPPTHRAFIENLTPYYLTPDILCVHGGAPLDGGPLQGQPVEKFIWGPEGFPDLYRGTEPVVYGHWGNAVLNQYGWPHPRILENQTYGIDTISHGVLTAMRFPDGRLFQSGRYRTASGA
jgi:serine/threonine protein phosphatase 1